MESNSVEKIDPFVIAKSLWDDTDPMVTSCLHQSSYIIGACEAVKRVKNMLTDSPIISEVNKGDAVEQDWIAFYQPLFNHMQDEHGLILLQSEMDEIIRVVNKMMEVEAKIPPTEISK